MNLLKYVRPGDGFIPTRYLDFSQKVDVNGDTEVPLYAWLKVKIRIIYSGTIQTKLQFTKLQVMDWFKKWLPEETAKGLVATQALYYLGIPECW